jgi:hypothetical protein
VTDAPGKNVWAKENDTMTTQNEVHQAATGTSNLPSARDLKEAMQEKERARAAEELKQQLAAKLEKKHQQEIFLQEKLNSEIISTLMTRILNAAERGESSILLGQFPSEWCTDGGRKINEPEPDWPDTLQGIAKEIYLFWERELKPKGYHLKVDIINFPGGKPGDVGAYLSWE